MNVELKVVIFAATTPRFNFVQVLLKSKTSICVQLPSQCYSTQTQRLHFPGRTKRLRLKGSKEPSPLEGMCKTHPGAGPGVLTAQPCSSTPPKSLHVGERWAGSEPRAAGREAAGRKSAGPRLTAQTQPPSRTTGYRG